MNAPTSDRREDILVSACLTDVPPTAAAISDIERFAAALAARFRFHEIILLTELAAKEAFLPLVSRVPNLRLFTLRDGLSPYHHRVVAASEAIGDVVLVATPGEFGMLDHLAMIERAADNGQIIVGLRPDPRGVNRALSILLEAAGRAAGFRAGLQDGPTIAFPRSLLNQLLEYSDPDLALRFIPRDPAFPVGAFIPSPGKSMPLEWRGFAKRVVLLDKLVLHMAPGALVLVALSSALLSCLGIAYTLYAIGIWLLAPRIEPGWLTISMMMGLTAVFLGGSIFGLSAGLQRVLALLRPVLTDSVVEEVSRADLFGNVASELNVDLHRAKP